MKLLLILSLVLNLALAAWAFRSVRASTSASAVPSGDIANRTEAATGSLAAKATPAKSAAVAGSAPSSATGTIVSRRWQDLYSANIAQFEQNLKAAGFSKTEIRAILTMQFETMRPQYAVGSDGKPRPYWQTETGRSFEQGDNLSPEIRREMRRIWNGAEYFAEEPGLLEFTRQRFGNLSVEKLAAIQNAYNKHEMNLVDQAKQIQLRPGESDTKRENAFRDMAAARDAEIFALLTPEERTEYEMHTSMTANQIQVVAGPLNLNDAEYEALYAVLKPFEGRMYSEGRDPGTRKALETEMAAQVALTLGEERAADYRAVQENPYDQTMQLVTRLGLPARTTNEIKDIRNSLASQASAVRANTALSAEERASLLATLAGEARTRLTSTLGTRGFEAYDDLKGEWIRALEK